jgi:chloramphenicol 3-O-phosphotransferase
MPTSSALRPLLITGPPAVGKSSVALLLADSAPPCAVVEVDDVRQLVKSGAAAPWEPGEGSRQTELAAHNTALLMTNFHDHGFNVIATDALLGDAFSAYADASVPPLVVHLHVSLAEARRRAGTRRVHLTDDEFQLLHESEQGASVADVSIDTTDLSPEECAGKILRLWTVDATR